MEKKHEYYNEDVDEDEDEDKDGEVVLALLLLIDGVVLCLERLLSIEVGERRVVERGWSMDKAGGGWVMCVPLCIVI